MPGNRIYFAELKRPGGKTSQLQNRQIGRLKDLGCNVSVIDSKEGVDKFLMIFKAHNYQRYCIERIISQKEIGLFLDMGLGKTVITLTALNDLLYNRFEISKALVIAPKKVAEGTWALEADKWDHLKHLRISTCLGR